MLVVSFEQQLLVFEFFDCTNYSASAYPDVLLSKQVEKYDSLSPLHLSNNWATLLNATQCLHQLRNFGMNKQLMKFHNLFFELHFSIIHTSLSTAVHWLSWLLPDPPVATPIGVVVVL